MLKKVFHITIVCICFLTTSAQRTPLTDTDSSNTITYSDETITQEVEKAGSYLEGHSENVLRDSSMYLNDFEIPKDSITAWKEQKKYAWSKSIDSLLKDRQSKNKKNFNVVGENTAKGLSILDRFFNAPAFKFVLWLIAFSLVAFVLFKLFLSNGIFRFSNKKQTGATQEVISDNINENNYESLFQKANATGDFRMAMRYLFLSVLQQLNEKDLIHFAIDKTNDSYLKELPTAKKNDFATLALYYEYIWYGNVRIEKETFSKIQIKVNAFVNKL